MKLYQPIVFKRWAHSKWERGFKMVGDGVEFFLQEDRKTLVTKVYKFRVNWI